MEPLLQALLTITGLFFLFLILKSGFKGNIKEQFCVICASVFVTWLSLLALLWLGIFEDSLIVALLIGESTVGIYYLVEARVRETLKIFRLPFLLSLILGAYSLITRSLVSSAILLVLGLWMLFTTIYLYRNHEGMNTLIKKLVECCKRW